MKEHNRSPKIYGTIMEIKIVTKLKYRKKKDWRQVFKAVTADSFLFPSRHYPTD